MLFFNFYVIAFNRFITSFMHVFLISILRIKLHAYIHTYMYRRSKKYFLFQYKLSYRNETGTNHHGLLSFQSWGLYSSSEYIFLMFVHQYFFEEYSDFDNLFVVGRISASWWSRYKSFLNPHVVNLSVCLFHILFSYNFRKNRKMVRKFSYVFELYDFSLHK